MWGVVIFSSKNIVLEKSVPRGQWLTSGKLEIRKKMCEFAAVFVKNSFLFYFLYTKIC